MPSDLCIVGRCHIPKAPHLDYCLLHAQLYCMVKGCHGERGSTRCILCYSCHTNKAIKCCAGCALSVTNPPYTQCDDDTDTEPGSDFVCETCLMTSHDIDRATIDHDICQECWDGCEDTEDTEDESMETSMIDLTREEGDKEEELQCLGCIDRVFHVCAY